MHIELHISRDWRTGGPLDIPRDGYRYECPDILVQVDVEPIGDDWRIEDAEVGEDVPRMREILRDGVPCVVTAEGHLFRTGERITLTGAEETEAVEEFLRAQQGVWD